MRKRRTLRKKRVKTQIVYQAEERKRQQIPRNDDNGLHPASSEDQSGRSLEDGIFNWRIWKCKHGAKQFEKGEKKQDEVESSYEAVEVKLSEPGNSADPKKNPSEQQAYESIREESQEHGYYNHGFNREKLDKPQHGENLCSCDYDNLSCTTEKMELSTAGYYNWSSNRERLEKPRGHVRPKMKCFYRCNIVCFVFIASNFSSVQFFVFPKQLHT